MHQILQLNFIRTLLTRPLKPSKISSMLMKMLNSMKFRAIEKTSMVLCNLKIGRIVSIRESGKGLLFCDILQGTSTLQAILSKTRFSDSEEFYSICKALQRGDIIGLCPFDIKKLQVQLEKTRGVNCVSLRII